MEVASSGVWRYGSAEAVQRDGEWWVALAGEAELVLPKGVVRDADFGAQPARIRSTIGETFDDLRNAVTMPDAEQSAEAVARHVGRYFAPELCGRHGLPYWHRATGGQCTPGGIGPTVAFPVAHVRRLVEFLDGIRDAVEQVTHRRQPLTRRQAGDLLGYLPLQSIEGIVRGELQRDGRVSLTRGRQVVRIALDSVVRSSGLHLSTRWPAQRQPQLAVVAHSSSALFAADLVMSLGQAGGAVECSVCGNLFTPRRQPRSGDSLYCQRPECQRRRLAVNQARYRQRKGS
jgi:hypothetical protein